MDIRTKLVSALMAIALAGAVLGPAAVHLCGAGKETLRREQPKQKRESGGRGSIGAGGAQAHREGPEESPFCLLVL